MAEQWRRFIGVDPSLRATGVVGVLMNESAVPGRWPERDGLLVRECATIKPGEDGALPVRFSTLEAEMSLRLRSLTRTPTTAIVMENPTDFTSFPGQRMRSPRDIGALGGAYAACCIAAVNVAAEMNVELHTYGTKEWYPRTRNRRRQLHPMRKEDVIALLRMHYPSLEKLNEHQVMAVGVVLHHAAKRVTRFELPKGKRGA